MRTPRPRWLLPAIAIVAILVGSAAALEFAPILLSGRPAPAPRLTASLATDAGAYLPGAEVRFTFVVTNSGDGIANLRFGSLCMASYTILDLNEGVAYDPRSHGACLQAFTNLSLRPGDSQTFQFSWDQTSDSGLQVSPAAYYRIRAFLQSVSPSPGPSAEATIFIAQDATPPDLAFTARTDRTSYDPGDTAGVTVRLTNIGSETVVMHFGQPCVVQFVVLDDAQNAVYNSSKEWACIQVVTDIVLAPGESRTHVFPWSLKDDTGGQLPAGHEYVVVPSFLWAYATPYQRYVTRTEVATFMILA